MAVDGEASQARLTVWSDPQPLTRGMNQLRLKIEDASGAPLGQLEIVVEPWMPAMGHGGPSVPRMIERGEGLYDVEDVALSMPGTWELRISISGAVDDHATLEVDIP